MRRAILWLSLAGVLFSGVLSARFFAGLCTGGCTIILGLPSCIYGLALFLALSGLATAAPVWRHGMLWIFGIAVFGALFSLTLAVKEMMVCIACYDLGLPNCAYGFAVFSAVAVLSFLEMRKELL